mmetsp:Transcript_6220/g.9381  ORF Transcript_6220/g.9381 Transcript_6220/m.9381 type:complete len:377 (-) Transcript_6220:260-1390(-)|eukprot:CAMPEP_0185017514 /NCGR_PEP_ID=MMETSP1103-20130426/455_1 /TAXON_ID=36769 /ORGANISM="Paraphysomonas bandaiensis, Strain Caron Lab Isolate" /LENGTH=376 /DNA_ID=CAMNT_0027546961 /DNA_START=97 /DNA_END=1227 /DNA_ORIENTATION=+
MWSAIKSDLLEFVTTVQTDTSSTISKVIKDNRKEESHELSESEKIVQNLRQDRETFSLDVDMKHYEQYRNFLKTFSLSANAADIARILEWEEDVSMFYADLVPRDISAETFWARYYFKLRLAQSQNIGEAFDDDEEELTWDETETKESDETAPGQDENIGQNSIDSEVRNVQGDVKETKDMTEISEAVNDEISQLRRENSFLKQRVCELEGEVCMLQRKLHMCTGENLATLQQQPICSMDSTLQGQSMRKEISTESDLSARADEIVRDRSPFVKIDSYPASSAESDGIVVERGSESDKEKLSSNSRTDEGNRRNTSILNSELGTEQANAVSTKPLVPVSPLHSKAAPSSQASSSTPPVLRGLDEDDEDEVGWDSAW